MSNSNELVKYCCVECNYTFNVMEKHDGTIKHRCPKCGRLCNMLLVERVLGNAKKASKPFADSLHEIRKRVVAERKRKGLPLLSWDDINKELGR